MTYNNRKITDFFRPSRDNSASRSLRPLMAREGSPGGACTLVNAAVAPNPSAQHTSVLSDGRTTANTLQLPIPSRRVSAKPSQLNPRKPLKLGSLNAQSLLSLFRLGEATALAHKMRIDALAIQEHRRTCITEIDGINCRKGWRFFHSSATDTAQGGVGMLLSPRAVDALQSVQFVSRRIIAVHLASSKGTRHWPKIVLVSCYSPHSGAPEESVEEFYADLQKLVDSVGNHAFLGILGDFNARLVQSQTARWVFDSPPNRNTGSLEEFLVKTRWFWRTRCFRRSKGNFGLIRVP